MVVNDVVKACYVLEPCTAGAKTLEISVLVFRAAREMGVVEVGVEQGVETRNVALLRCLATQGIGSANRLRGRQRFRVRSFRSIVAEHCRRVERGRQGAHSFSVMIRSGGRNLFKRRIVTPAHGSGRCIRATVASCFASWRRFRTGAPLEQFLDAVMGRRLKSSQVGGCPSE